MKIFFSLIISTLLISCGEKIDVEKIEYGTIFNPNEVLKEFQEDFTSDYEIKSFSTVNIDNLKIGDINLESYAIKNGYPIGVNEIYILVEDFKSKKYLGFDIRLTNDTGDKIIEHFKNKYGNPEIRNGSANSIAYVWNTKDSWILIDQTEEINKNKEAYKETYLTYVKKGTKVYNSKKANVMTILESFNSTYPK
ncbi:hypothetical protein V3470_14225 [Flavobacterium oreochromis]|uniref:DUF4136 domain-containing protein n=1 Tax=Flavobacterium oreochromis TaxID=2906078 RepID=A0ABW8P809_9FLAO|nr:hypothetical protein [Flavobacterium oreochromis]OWP74192.1 hypothetical protein BWG23_14675 [Flavobacterium oreochromis]